MNGATGHRVTGHAATGPGGHEGVRATCTCGWVSRIRYGSLATRAAQNDARSHFDQAVAA